MIKRDQQVHNKYEKNYNSNFWDDNIFRNSSTVKNRNSG